MVVGDDRTIGGLYGFHVRPLPSLAIVDHRAARNSAPAILVGTWHAQFGGTHQHDSLTTYGKYTAVLVTYTLPSQTGRPTEYGA